MNSSNLQLFTHHIQNMTANDMRSYKLTDNITLDVIMTQKVHST